MFIRYRAPRTFPDGRFPKGGNSNRNGNSNGNFAAVV
jgi:hypothetical protein